MGNALCYLHRNRGDFELEEREEGMITTQGKCIKCKIAYRWYSKYRKLREAKCPRCGEQLKQTSCFLEWPWVFWYTTKQGRHYLELIKEKQNETKEKLTLKE